MRGFSWKGERGRDGTIELHDDGSIVIVAEHCGCESVLTDRSMILSLYHALGDWLMAHPENRQTPREG